MYVASAVLGWLTYRRERRIADAKATVPALQPDRDELESWFTADLIDKHDEGQRMANEGSPATLGDEVLHAIEEVLRHRGVPLCACGAALPGGVHLTNCPES